jgi:hypothetical protein
MRVELTVVAAALTLAGCSSWGGFKTADAREAGACLGRECMQRERAACAQGDRAECRYPHAGPPPVVAAAEDRLERSGWKKK